MHAIQALYPFSSYSNYEMPRLYVNSVKLYALKT